jgi:hypothetical protein
MRFIVAFALILLLTAAAIVGLVYSGLPNVAASGKDPAPLRWFPETTREHSVARRAAYLAVPGLSQQQTAAGASEFDAIGSGRGFPS